MLRLCSFRISGGHSVAFRLTYGKYGRVTESIQKMMIDTNSRIIS